MAKSTRQRILDQHDYLMNAVERVEEHLGKIGVLSEGRNDKLNEVAPLILAMNDEMRHLIASLKEIL